MRCDIDSLSVLFNAQTYGSQSLLFPYFDEKTDSVGGFTTSLPLKAKRKMMSEIWLLTKS